MNRVFREDLEAIIEEDIPWGKLNGRTVLITGASGMIGTTAWQTATLKHSSEICYLCTII